MNLPKLAIKNYQFAIIAICLGLFVGLQSFFNMPRNEDPNPEFPFYTVVAIYPGTSPEDMEELVVDPLEDAIDKVDDIVKVNTKIEEGVAVIRAEASFDVDPDDKYEDVLAEINAIQEDLPDDLYSLDVDKFSPNSRVKIQQFALVSETLPYKQLIDLAEQVETKIEQINGIDDVEIDAYPEEEIRVSIDFQRMANQNIPLQQVLGILQGNNINIPGGDVNAGFQSFNIKSSGGYKTLEEIENTVVGSNGEQLVYLRDIATIQFDYEDIKWIGRYNGKRALFLSVTQKKGNNLVAIGEKIQAKAEEFRQTLPAEIELISVFEQAPAVQARIDDFFNNLMQGVALVGIIIFIFLGFRPSVIIMTVIPISIIMAIGMLDMSGYALQQISIAALVIALGLLVDNGIVVIENVVRFQREGYGFLEAAAKGTAEVGYAIISSTVTTLLAFFPLLMMESGPGEFLRTLPLTVIFVLVASLILALTFTPILAGKFLKVKKREKPKLIDHFLKSSIEKLYRPTLAFSLKRGWVIMLLAVGIFMGSVTLFPSIGVSFFPTADKPLLLIDIEAPRGTNIDRTNEATKFVEQVLDTTAFVRDYAVNTGHGNPTIYYNRFGENYKKYYAQVLVNFEEWNPAKFYETLASFRQEFAKYHDAKITFSELKNGPPFEAPIEIKILGNNLDTLKRLSFMVEDVVSKAEGTLNVDNPLAVNKTDLKVNINRDKAGLLGIPLWEIDQAVRASLTGIKVDEVTTEDGEEYNLVVRMPFDDQPTIEDFNKVYFTTQSGGQVPLKQVANIEFDAATSQILHYNFDRSTAVTADVFVADQTAAITENIITELEKLEFPNGYSYYVAGEYEEQQDSFGDLGTLLIIAMLGIFAVLVLQFRSVVQPIVVFSAIPLAITGSFVALYLTGWSFSFFAFVGFISLVGIVVNNSIILVDYTNQLISEGMKVSDAVKKACETRFTPILLTTTTTILGLLPLTLSQTNLWSPLGWTIIGGMVSSTFLTLVVVPVLLNWFTKEKKLEVEFA